MSGVVDPTEVGRVVRERRLELALTQREAAIRAGVSQRWWGDFERGAARVELAHVMRAAATVGLTLHLLPWA